LRYILLQTKVAREVMATKSKKRRTSGSAKVHDLENGARKKSPATVALRTKAGRLVFTSPAKSATSLASWSRAFAGK
jgi:hypothetical protein